MAAAVMTAGSIGSKLELGSALSGSPLARGQILSGNSSRGTWQLELVGKGVWRVAAPRASPPRATAVRCGQSEEGKETLSRHGEVGRRELLSTCSGVLLGATLSNLWVPGGVVGGVAGAADLTQRFQRGEFLGKVKDKLRLELNKQRDLVPDLMKLALNDSLTYDKATNTGGANGSVRFELKRPENAGLERAVEFLGGVKAELDEKLKKWGPLTWADLIQLGAQSATKRTFIDSAVRKCGGNEEKGQLLYQATGSNGQWGQFDKLLGREDAEGPDPEGRVLVWDQASPDEITARFAQVGIKPRYVTVLSAFLGHDQKAVEEKLLTDKTYAPSVKQYRESRDTVSQTDYEVDLISTFSKVAVFGQKINTEAYTFKPPPLNLRF